MYSVYLKGIEDTDSILGVVEYFFQVYPVVEPRLWFICAGRMAKSITYVAQSTVEGRIQIDVDRFNALPTNYQRMHVVAHELFHQAYWWLVEHGKHVILDVPEPGKVSRLAMDSDVELFCEIGAMHLLGYAKVSWIAHFGNIILRSLTESGNVQV